MKNKITHAQFNKLEKLAAKWEKANFPNLDWDDAISLMPVSKYGDGPLDFQDAAAVDIKLYDLNGKTEATELHELIKKAGIELDVDALLSAYDINRLEAEEGDDYTPRAYYSTECALTHDHGDVALYVISLPIAR